MSSVFAHLPEADAPRQAKTRFGKGFSAKALKTKVECTDALVEIGAEIAQIRGQLDEAEAFPETVADDEGREWLLAARTALRWRHVHKAAIEIRLGQIRDDEAPRAADAAEARRLHHFRRLCEERMGHAEFEALWRGAEARRRAESA